MNSAGPNFISEWYGVRLYPSASGAPTSVAPFRSRCCPFLSDTLGATTQCVKNPNSSGVCTITTTKKESRDWIVCPYRALERQLIQKITRKIFSDTREDLPVYPVVHLQNADRRSEIFERASREIVYVFFQDKLGGEINVKGSNVTPELSFDITIVECRSEANWLILKRYGLFEVQTMDFHGSYQHAVKALKAAVDLHADNFTAQLEENQEWLGRKIEGPNIANVFKRTIYQLILKFDIAGRDRCAGVVLGLPEAVWNSWKPHFGGLEWANDCRDERGNSWIFVLRPEQYRESGYSRMKICKEIRMEAQTLVHRSFTVVPEKIAKNTLPEIFESIVSRTRRFYEHTKPEID